MATDPKKLSDRECELLYARARLAGLEAGAKQRVHAVVFTVEGGGQPPQDFYEPEGLCGFAWVVIRPANARFANWLRARDLGHPHYGGGWAYWVSDFNQCVSRKEAYAEAFAEVLSTAGIHAHAGSRLD